MVAQDRKRLSISRACELTAVSRSGFYKSREPSPDRDRTLCREIESIVKKLPGYGYRRVTHELSARGHQVNHKRVLRVMRHNGLLCRVRGRKPRTTQSDHDLGAFPNLAEGLKTTGINQLWVADLTYVRLPGEYAYLAVVLDAHSRRVLGWELGRRLDASLTMKALQQALTLRPNAKGVIHHSDQGVQYAAKAYVKLARDAGLVMSMSRRASPQDNAQAESFFATLKAEETKLTEYLNLEEARTRIEWFIERVYNKKRLHSSLGYLSPIAFELAEHSTPMMRSEANSNAPSDQDTIEKLTNTLPQSHHFNLDKPLNTTNFT